MLPDRVSNPGPLTYEPGALPIALCSPPSNAYENADGIANGVDPFKSHLICRLSSDFI